MLNPATTSDQSPRLQQDSTTDRLEAARTEQRHSKFDKNWQLSQDIFSPTQSISQTQFNISLHKLWKKPITFTLPTFTTQICVKKTRALHYH